MLRELAQVAVIWAAFFSRRHRFDGGGAVYAQRNRPRPSIASMQYRVVAQRMTRTCRLSATAILMAQRTRSE
ncbi:hypothetical protein FHY29_003087 [Xanthomonas arboricola]|nr:hypothetical protein XacyCFBP2565_02595 [Xanthomonas arboricola pv. corylina]PPU52468.1 hypothetical protein XarbCFBP6827_13505 [Xanthomonas arboricola]